MRRVESAAEIPSAVVDFIEANGLARQVIATSDDLVGGLRWTNELAVEQRRAHADDEVSITATYGAIAETVDAAGYRHEDPWFLSRGLRERTTYLGLAVGLIVAGLASIWVGVEFYEDPLGLFYQSPWATGIGYGVGAALLVLAALCAFIGVAYRSTPRLIMRLVSQTSLGRIILPTEADHEAALNRIAKE